MYIQIKLNPGEDLKVEVEEDPLQTGRCFLTHGDLDGISIEELADRAGKWTQYILISSVEE